MGPRNLENDLRAILIELIDDESAAITKFQETPGSMKSEDLTRRFSRRKFVARIGMRLSDDIQQIGLFPLP